MKISFTAQAFRLLSITATSLLFSLAAQADYVAYTLGDGSIKEPLPREIDGLGAKEMLNVEWGNYSGPKTRIGVLQVENRSSSTTINLDNRGGTIEYEDGITGVPVQGIEAIITDIMHRTGRFRIVERTVLNEALREQDLGASGRIAKPSAAKVGNILGAEYLFQAVITNYEAGVESKGGGLLGAVGGSAGTVLGGLAVKSSKGVIGMNFRLIDAETTEVIYTDQVEIEVKESGLALAGFGVGSSAAGGGFMGGYAKTPIGQAVIAACNKGVYGLIKQVGTTPATGKVIQVKDGKIYLNLNEDVLSVGEIMTVRSLGEELIDPDTGISLGSEEKELGTIEVSQTGEKFSLAVAREIDLSVISRGDVVISQKPAAKLQFGSGLESKSAPSGSATKQKKFGLF